MAADGDEAEPPRVRPVRIVVASVLGVLGAAGAFVSWFVIHPWHPRPEAHGSAAAVGQSLAAVVGWGSLVVCALIAVVSAITVVLALLETRAGRTSAP